MERHSCANGYVCMYVCMYRLLLMCLFSYHCQMVCYYHYGTDRTTTVLNQDQAFPVLTLAQYLYATGDLKLFSGSKDALIMAWNITDGSERRPQNTLTILDYIFGAVSMYVYKCMYVFTYLHMCRSHILPIYYVCTCFNF